MHGVLNWVPTVPLVCSLQKAACVLYSRSWNIGAYQYKCYYGTEVMVQAEKRTSVCLVGYAPTLKHPQHGWAKSHFAGDAVRNPKWSTLIRSDPSVKLELGFHKSPHTFSWFAKPEQLYMCALITGEKNGSPLKWGKKYWAIKLG